jgi:UDP-N-acetylmuramoylalanine--D-glutamate ligase
MHNVADQHIVVIGGARSGVPVAELLQRHGASVLVTDYGAIAPAMKERLDAAEIPFEENGHTPKARQGDFAVVSPGVPTSAPIVQHYLGAGKKVYSEIEVASWFNCRPTIGITGSNGKTTVTRWLDHLLDTADAEHEMAGNIGRAFSEIADQNDEDCANPVVLEISSFQLDHIDEFHPTVGVLLNITPDHLDRYENSLEQYAAAKFRLFEHQTDEEWLVYNYDDPMIKQRVEQLQQMDPHPRLLAFSKEDSGLEGAFVRDHQIMFRINKHEEVLMPADELSLRGSHNLHNGLATALAARATEIKNEHIRESLKSFEGVEHRLELVRVLDGVSYINDSKATNVNAVWYALDSIPKPIVLILGGRDKGNDYTEIRPLIRERVEAIVAIGESKDKIKTELENCVPALVEAQSMEEAVRLAKQRSVKGSTVLLSPACASFDMFESYEDRGNVFKRAVINL